MNAKTQWVAYTTLVRFEIGRILRIWRQTLFPPIITQSLYFVIFGGFIGSQIRTINGVPYMLFIVPGLIMMSIITAAFTNTSFSFFASKFQRNIEELLVAPIKMSTLLAGYVTSGLIRGLVTGVIVFLVSLFFVRPTINNLFILILFAVLTCIVFSLGGLLNGIYAKTFDDVGIFATFVLTPLTYLGGVFYPITALPPFWQTASRFNPVVYMVDGFRYGITGFNEFPLWSSLGILIVFTLTLGYLCLYLLKKGRGLKT